jgi:excisionase family DNA binding protein
MAKQKLENQKQPEQPQPPVGRILTIQECADRLKKHRNTISRWIRDGLLPAVVNPSGLVGVREEVLNSFYANNVFLPKEKILERLDFKPQKK